MAELKTGTPMLSLGQGMKAKLKWGLWARGQEVWMEAPSVEAVKFISAP